MHADVVTWWFTFLKKTNYQSILDLFVCLVRPKTQQGGGGADIAESRLFQDPTSKDRMLQTLSAMSSAQIVSASTQKGGSLPSAGAMGSPPYGSPATAQVLVIPS